ncbi:androgen dependent TFPI regulating protein, partial [Chelydra serpentina]
LYGRQWKYLTVLNLVLQAVFYGISFLADVLRLIKKLPSVKYIISCRDLLFSVLAFPVATFVFMSFWVLYTYNRELVYPKSLDGIIPMWLNH